MTVEIKFKVLLLLFILAFFLKIIIFPPSAQAAVVNAKSYKIIVSAAIGEPKLTLWGYSSPNSLVQLQGERVAEETIAQSDGYFLFDRIFLPLPNPDYPELCLSAIDTQSRISFPVCLPPLPVGLFDLSVGPVLLPPTISLEKGFFLPKEQISAEGLTIPNTQVNIFLANEISRKKTLLGKAIRLFNFQAEAYYLPQYQIKADQSGHFEFNLPTAKATNWRLFSSANFLGSPTPKSNTLSFKVLTWWEWLLLLLSRLLGAIWRLLRPYWWLIILLVEITVAVVLLTRQKTLRQKKAKRFLKNQ